MHLLDTNVVSELRRPRPHGGVVAWLRSIDDIDLHLSAVSLGEFQVGIERMREQDPLKAAELDRWAGQLATAYNLLPMDVATFRLWAKLMHRRSATLYEDAMIAATASVHRLTVVTRKTRDFAPFGVPTFDPFATGRP